MITADYEFAPDLYRTWFRIPIHINLKPLKKYLEQQSMDVRVKGNHLFAQNGETYIHVSCQGRIKINSFSSFDVKQFCERLLEYARSQAAA